MVDEVLEDVKVPKGQIEKEVVVLTKEEVIDIPEDIVIVIENEETKPDTEG